MSNKQESTTKEIFYLTNEFGLYFTNGKKLVKCFKLEVLVSALERLLWCCVKN